MSDKNYRLQVLPLFEDDLTEITGYIANVLENPQAAMKLVDDVEKAVMERLPFAESFDRYPSVKERILPYYRIPVNNYTVFTW